MGAGTRGSDLKPSKMKLGEWDAGVWLGPGQLRMTLPMMPPTAPAAALLPTLSPETCEAT